MDKKLYRSEFNKMIGGVCSGIGEYLNVDPNIIRLGLVLLALFKGLGIILYLAAWALLPEESTGENLISRLGEHRERVNDIKLWGIMMIAIGIIALLWSFLPHIDWKIIAAVLIIVAGGYLILKKG